MIRAISLIALALMLSGCVTTGSTPSAICNALVGPIKYNSTNPQSKRFAGPALAPDLAVRNRVGINLSCPKYR